MVPWPTCLKSVGLPMTGLDRRGVLYGDRFLFKEEVRCSSAWPLASLVDERNADFSMEGGDAARSPLLADNFLFTKEFEGGSARPVTLQLRLLPSFGGDTGHGWHNSSCAFSSSPAHCQ